MEIEMDYYEIEAAKKRAYDEVAALVEEWRKARTKRSEERQGMAERLRARDEAYAAAYPAMAGGAVRGRVAAGGRCGVIRQDEVNLAVSMYVARTREM